MLVVGKCVVDVVGFCRGVTAFVIVDFFDDGAVWFGDGFLLSIYCVGLLGGFLVGFCM